MREKVIIIGGGVAGLTAAHELIERDFEVHVFERRDYLGGKSASVPVSTSSSAAADSTLPGEHGFRFFPGWYKHLPDTLKRIPFQGRRDVYQGGTVHDNLVSVSTNLLTWSTREAVPLPLRAPTSVGGLSQASEFLHAFGRLGFTSSDVAHFIAKLGAFLAVPDDERSEQFEQISWWDYLGCAERSQAFQDLIRATTRTLIAAKAEEVSAYTMGRLAARTLLDTLGTVDRILNGPTSTVWIDPWRKYLEARGVKFSHGLELDALVLSSKKNELEGVTFQSFAIVEARRARRALAAVRRGLEHLLARFELNSPVSMAASAPSRVDAVADQIRRDVWEELRSSIADLASDVGNASKFVSGVTTSLEEKSTDRGAISRAAADTFAALDRLLERLPLTGEPDTWTHLWPALQAAHSDATAASALVETLETALYAMESPPPQMQEANYFVFALPVEQMAYYVNRSPALTQLAPELRSLRRLSYYLDWMSGIQFYLHEPFEVADGHIVCLDSEWSLTAIEQTKHWHDVTWPSTVKAIISVDIARWDRRGRFVQKEPYNCTPEEIAQEVWAELQAQLNRRTILLRDEMLRRPPGAAPPLFQKDFNFHLDAALVDLRDRKKQALYEKARGVRFSAAELQEDANAEGELPSHLYMWGPHRSYNVEPLLVNRAGSRRFRPDTKTSVANMFLAGDYVLTETDLACMEGANEAARRAVNGVLDAAGSRAERCRLWNLSSFGDLSRIAAMFSAASMVRTANRGVIETIKNVKDRVFQGLGQQIVEHRKQRLER